MQTGRRRQFTFSFLLGAQLLCLAGLAQTQSPSPAVPQTREQLERLIYSVKGSDLFYAHCAPCHGPGGRGDGPMASALKTKPPDLTVLAKNNRGQFPSAYVRKVIVGEEALDSHGSRVMPVWGPIFHQVEDDRDYGNVRVQNLVNYLASIQRK